MKIKAYAKLNLSLNLLPEKLKNGLYPVKFINCQIDLCDILEIKKGKNFPLESDNLIHKAAEILGVGAEVKLQKNIPLLGGLGGGSSDAAETLKTLIKLYKLKISEKQLNNLANKLGKDVCYLIEGGLCEVGSDGTKIKRLPYKLPKLYLLIIYPKAVKPSTGFMYENLDKNKIGKNLDKFLKMKKAIKENNKIEIIKNLFNDFEELAIKKFEEILKIKNDFKKAGALNTILLGSGLGVAGFFDSKKKQNEAITILERSYSNIIKSSTR